MHCHLLKSITMHTLRVLQAFERKQIPMFIFSHSVFTIWGCGSENGLAHIIKVIQEGTLFLMPEIKM